MATFVPYASCYKNERAVRLLGKNSCLSLLVNPPCLIGPREPLACPAPEMTLRQLSQLTQVLKQLRVRDTKEAQRADPPSRSRSAGSPPAPHQNKSSKQHCLPCFWPRRSSSPARVG